MYSAIAAWGYSKQPLSRNSSPGVIGKDERWEAPDPPQDVLPQIWGRTELNCTVTCMVLKAMVNDWCTSSHLP
ncbi:hypothetical protein TNCV_3968261 [Trichonephila clavipes]|nr:hypothetical protein TNCV_3968261 [Trichonephila clavipes]